MNFDNFEVIRIGEISHGIDGKDEYLRVITTRSKQEIQNIMNFQYLRDSIRPGGYFCNQVSVIPVPHYDAFICIVHHRYDV